VNGRTISAKGTRNRTRYSPPWKDYCNWYAFGAERRNSFPHFNLTHVSIYNEFMRRAALGIIAVFLLGGGIALQIAQLETSWAGFAAGVLMKTGGVLLLFWLAYHQVLRLFEIVPPWIIGAGFVALGAIIAFPRHALIALGLFAALLVLHFAGFLIKPLAAKRQAKGKPRSQVPNSKSQI
jgi:hypothetical protein